MKFVEIDQNTGAVSWDRYFAYLKSNRDQLSRSLYEFASDWSRYSLDGEETLHDAWLEMIQLRSREGPCELTISLLGGSHDRCHVLSYSSVQDFDQKMSITTDRRCGSRDLIVHEFRVEQLGVCHELLFGDGSLLSTTFEEFSYECIPVNVSD